MHGGYDVDYHEVLAELGVGSAHPGGFTNTKQWMQKVAFEKGLRVLEVGCGTGRTACELTLRYGLSVTAADIRPNMLVKARARAQAAKADIEFVRVIGKNLPFKEEQFECIVAESVTVFNPVHKMLREYVRVLQQGGFVVDTEMCAVAPLPPDVMKAFTTTYGAHLVPTMSEWKTLFTTAGFSSIEILQSGPIRSEPLQDEPDLWSLQQSATNSKEVLSVVEQNQEVMSTFHKWLNYATFLARK